MFGLDWAAIGNYSIAIFVTVAILLAIFQFSTKGRIWKTFNEDQYKCGMVNILSNSQTPNLTGLFSTPTAAAKAALTCNSPQAFIYDHNLCTLNAGNYTCYPQPTSGQSV